MFNQVGNTISGVIKHFGLAQCKLNQDTVKEKMLACGLTSPSVQVGACSYSVEDLKRAVKNSFTLKEVCFKLNLSIHSSNYRKINDMINDHSIDTSHFKSGISHNRAKLSLQETFCKDSNISRTSLRNKIISYDILDLSSCDKCGITTWNEKPIKIQVDHINGDSRDNRIENLRGLCPNCHSQTSTYCGNKH